MGEWHDIALIEEGGARLKSTDVGTFAFEAMITPTPAAKVEAGA